jgi:hypothetical protein
VTERSSQSCRRRSRTLLRGNPAFSPWLPYKSNAFRTLFVASCTLLGYASACGGDAFRGAGGTGPGSGATGGTSGATAAGGSSATSATAGTSGTSGTSGAGATGAGLNDGSPQDSVITDTTTDARPDNSSDSGIVGDVTRPPDAPARDALADGGPKEAAVDVASPAWCAGTRAVFCADFDTVAAPTDGWTSANVTAGTALDFNLVAFASPPRSLRSKIPSGSGPEVSAASLSKVVSTSRGRSLVDFRCNVTSLGAGSGDWLLGLARLGRNGSESAVALVAEDTATWAVFVTDDLPVLHAALPAPPEYGRFVRVSLDVVWSATAGSVRVAFDGVTVFSREGIATGVAPTTSSVELTLGWVEGVGTTPAAEVFIDNVALELQ